MTSQEAKTADPGALWSLTVTVLNAHTDTPVCARATVAVPGGGPRGYRRPTPPRLADLLIADMRAFTRRRPG